MKKVILLVCVFVFTAAMAIAAESTTYMLDGTITEIKGDVFTIKKDNAKYEMTRDAGAKVNGEMKVGSKVKVAYKMTATTVVVIDDKKAGTNK